MEDSQQAFEEKLDALINAHIEDDRAKMEEVISALELKLMALKEEQRSEHYD